jgi:hypothetical protein
MPRFPDEFPDEVLLKIVGCFESSFDETLLHFDSDLDLNIKTIQSIRLTCKRLCQISSQLLIPYIHVTPSLKSLDQVVKVASHPTISRGVRRVFIDVKLVEEKAVEYLEYYFTYQEAALERIMDYYGMDNPGMITIESERFLVKAGFVLTIMESLHPPRNENGPPLIHKLHLDEPQLSIRRLLQQGYARCQERYQEQNEIIRSGRFVSDVAEAIAKLGPSVHLYISDNHDNPSINDRYGLMQALREHGDRDMDSEFIMKLTDKYSVLGWKSVLEGRGDEQTCQSLQSIFYRLPLAIKAAGGNLTGFTIDMGGCFQSFAPPVLIGYMTKEVASDLEEAFRSLQSFSFRVQAPLWAPSLSTFLSAVVGSQQLSNLSLDLVPIGHHLMGDAVADAGTIRLLGLPENSWGRLKSLSLKRFYIHLGQLKQMLSVVQPGCDLILDGIWLLSGSWAEALDDIRSKAGLGSYLICPRGQECNEMQMGPYEEIFGDYYMESTDLPVSKATRYIRSIDGYDNPLRLMGREMGTEEQALNATEDQETGLTESFSAM